MSVFLAPAGGRRSPLAATASSPDAAASSRLPDLRPSRHRGPSRSCSSWDDVADDAPRLRLRPRRPRPTRPRRRFLVAGRRQSSRYQPRPARSPTAFDVAEHHGPARDEQHQSADSERGEEEKQPREAGSGSGQRSQRALLDRDCGARAGLGAPGARRLRLAQMPGGRRRCPGLRGWTPLDSTGELLDDLGRRAGEQRRADRDRYGRLPTATCCRRQTECLRRARLKLTLSAQAHPQAPGDLLLALAAAGAVAGAPREDLLSLRLQRRHARAEHADDASQVLVPSVRRGVLLGRLQRPLAGDSTRPVRA